LGASVVPSAVVITVVIVDTVVIVVTVVWRRWRGWGSRHGSGCRLSPGTRARRRLGWRLGRGRHRVRARRYRGRALVAVTSRRAAARLASAPLEPLTPFGALAALDALAPFVGAIGRRGLLKLDGVDPRRVVGTQQRCHGTNRPRPRDETGGEQGGHIRTHHTALTSRVSESALMIILMCTSHAP
jgi:hypothetical protein